VTLFLMSQILRLPSAELLQAKAREEEDSTGDILIEETAFLCSQRRGRQIFGRRRGGGVRVAEENGGERRR
jgi:hypothetical protein